MTRDMEPEAKGVHSMEKWTQWEYIGNKFSPTPPALVRVSSAPRLDCTTSDFVISHPVNGEGDWRTPEPDC